MKQYLHIHSYMQDLFNLPKGYVIVEKDALIASRNQEVEVGEVLDEGTRIIREIVERVRGKSMNMPTLKEMEAFLTHASKV